MLLKFLCCIIMLNSVASLGAETNNKISLTMNELKLLLTANECFKLGQEFPEFEEKSFENFEALMSCSTQDCRSWWDRILNENQFDLMFYLLNIFPQDKKTLMIDEIFKKDEKDFTLLIYYMSKINIKEIKKEYWDDVKKKMELMILYSKDHRAVSMARIIPQDASRNNSALPVRPWS